MILPQSSPRSSFLATPVMVAPHRVTWAASNVMVEVIVLVLHRGIQRRIRKWSCVYGAKPLVPGWYLKKKNLVLEPDV